MSSMPGRVVEVATAGLRVSLSRGFLKVSDGDAEVGRVALADVDCLLLAEQGTTISANAIAALTERGAPIALCGRDYAPGALLFPLGAHTEASARMDAQVAASLPTRKRLWAEVVKRKIRAQAALLARMGKPSWKVERFAAKVRSGDADNREARAAWSYWRALMGPDFRREKRGGGGVNALFNYGYTALRAATARAIAAAGLHPMVGLHHRTRGDGLRLADDLMEPFRPCVDWRVARLAAEGVDALTPEVKRDLVSVLHADMECESGVSPLSVCLVRLASSLAQAFQGARRNLEWPTQPLPLEASAVDGESGADDDDDETA